MTSDEIPLKIHFLNVGSGDCTIIHFPVREVKSALGNIVKEKNERITMIDLNQFDDHEEYEDVINYYKENFGNKPIFRFICTHPHHDHICGLYKLFYESGVEILNFWDIVHGFVPENFDGHPWHKRDWETYQYVKNPNTPSPRTINITRETPPSPYWGDDEDRITILSPSIGMIREAHNSKENGQNKEPQEIEIDEISYALLLKINNIRVIFAGDGKQKAWDDIYQNCNHLIKDCNILKAGHHGHTSALHNNAIRLMNPDYVIVSNSYKEDNDNGVAEKDYKELIPSANIYKTHKYGTIIANCYYSNGEIILTDKFGNLL